MVIPNRIATRVSGNWCSATGLSEGPPLCQQLLGDADAAHPIEKPLIPEHSLDKTMLLTDILLNEPSERSFAVSR